MKKYKEGVAELFAEDVDLDALEKELMETRSE